MKRADSDNLIDLHDLRLVGARRPILVAHRGGVIGPNAPENSGNAIRQAARCGYDLVELDVVAARHDEPVLFHDWGTNLRRLCGVDASLQDMTAAELGRITYRASDQSILSLAEALALCRQLNLGVMLDLKVEHPSKQWIEQVATLLHENGLDQASMTISFNPQVWDRFLDVVLLRVTPDQSRRVETGDPVALKDRFWFDLPEDLPDSLVSLLQASGALVIPAVNTFRYPPHADQELAHADINRLLALGVDGFQIDSGYGTDFGLPF